MNERGAKLVLLFVGLPYTGKTTIVRAMIDRVPGKEIIADSIYLEEVPPSEVGLYHWLDHGPVLVDRIKNTIRTSTGSVFYVELGIMQRRNRTDLTDWLRDGGYRVLPIWLKCDDMVTVRERRALRASEADSTRIDISIDGLYEEIRNAFEEPNEAEGYREVDTVRDLPSCVNIVAEVMGR